MEDAASSGDQIGVSAITLAEIVYLSERNRIREGTLERLLAAMDTEESLFIEVPFDRHVAETLQEVDRTQIPDRIIAATAIYMDVPSISRDRKIQLADIETLW